MAITVTNGSGKSAKAEVTLFVSSVFGLENFAPMTVDQERDLLQGLSVANGGEIVKVEIMIDGVRTVITDAHHYIPEYPGTCSVIYTVKARNGSVSEVTVSNVTIKPLDYQVLTLTSIRPVDILPIIGQVEAGDKNVYSHIEHLRVAEATRVRDMMWKYGAGNHSAQQYQQLMMRLNTGMTREIPK